MQVSHAITTHRAEAEDDYYVAADDLKNPEEDPGAGFLGTAGFGSGIYYTYACINRDLLIENLAGDIELAQRGATAFVRAMAESTPSGKKNSFAHQTKAYFIRAEADDFAPRSLAQAFFEPIKLTDGMEQASTERLRKTADSIDKAYETVPSDTATMDTLEGQGGIKDILALVERAFEDA